MRKKGFTLIELLVVIAIIALLLSVMLPGLKKAKSYARRVIGSTNLRSLSMALHIYLNSNNDRFFDYGSGTLWMDRIADAIDDLDAIRFCPVTKGKIDEVKNEYTGQSIWGSSPRPWLWNSSTGSTEPYELGSYGLNGWYYAQCAAPNGCFICNATPAEKNLLFQNRAAVKNPSKAPFILDANWVDAWARNTNVLPTTGYRYEEGDATHGGLSVPSMIGRFIMDRHGPETNVIFLDGQVQTIPHADLWTLYWHRNSKPNFNAIVPQPIPAKK